MGLYNSKDLFDGEGGGGLIYGVIIKLAISI